MENLKENPILIKKEGELFELKINLNIERELAVSVAAQNSLSQGQTLIIGTPTYEKIIRTLIHFIILDGCKVSLSPNGYWAEKGETSALFLEVKNISNPAEAGCVEKKSLSYKDLDGNFIQGIYEGSLYEIKKGDYPWPF